MEHADLITYEAASEFLSVPLSTLYSMVSRRQVPHYRMGPRFVRFSRAELLAWIQRGHVPAYASSETQASSQNSQP